MVWVEEKVQYQQVQEQKQLTNMKPIKKVYEEMISNLLEKRNEYLENLYEKNEDVQNFVIDSPKISKRERINITNQIHKSKMLGGNLKVDSISKGLHELGNILDSCGFSLDMVNGDMVMGPQGNALLTFRRKTDNPFIEGQEIESSRISFTWENLEPLEDGVETKKRYEILAYLT